MHHCHSHFLISSSTSYPWQVHILSAKAHEGVTTIDGQFVRRGRRTDAYLFLPVIRAQPPARDSAHIFSRVVSINHGLTLIPAIFSRQPSSRTLCIHHHPPLLPHLFNPAQRRQPVTSSLFFPTGDRFKVYFILHFMIYFSPSHLLADQPGTFAYQFHIFFGLPRRRRRTSVQKSHRHFPRIFSFSLHIIFPLITPLHPACIYNSAIECNVVVNH